MPVMLSTTNISSVKVMALSIGATRAGLVVAGDAKASVEEAVVRSSSGASTLGPDTGDLLQFLISDEYFALRAELGIAPGPR